MNELVADVAGAIEALGYDRCTLVAHDWGGAVAWGTAYAHPAMVKRLIVMNLPHPVLFKTGLTQPRQLLRSWYIVFFQLPLLPEWGLRLRNYHGIAAAFESMAIDKSAFPEEALNHFRKAAAQEGALTAMINYYRANFKDLFNKNSRPQERDILSVPTLMIWGEEDTALGKELTYGTEEYVTDFQIRYIPNCSHWVQQEQPELVNQYMRDFLGL